MALLARICFPGCKLIFLLALTLLLWYSGQISPVHKSTSMDDFFPFPRMWGQDVWSRAEDKQCLLRARPNEQSTEEVHEETWDHIELLLPFPSSPVHPVLTGENSDWLTKMPSSLLCASLTSLPWGSRPRTESASGHAWAKDQRCCPKPS